MIDYIDLYTLLSTTKSLRGVGIYCHVDSQMNRPSALRSDVLLQAGGKFVSATIFAVNLKPYKQELLNRGLIGESDRFLVNASVSVYIDENLPVSDWYYFEGTLALSSTTARMPLCTLAMFRKNGTQWLTTIVKAQDFEVTHFQNTVRQWRVLNASISAGNVQVPADVARCTRLFAELPNIPEVSIPEPAFSSQPSNGVEPIPDFSSVTKSQEANKGMCSDALNGVQVPEATGLRKTIKEDRSEIKPMPELFNALKDTLKVASKSQQDYIKSLSREYSLGGTSLVVIESFFNKILKYWRTKPSDGYAYTGRAMMKKYISNLGEDVEQEYLGQKVIDLFLSMSSELFDFCLSGEDLPIDGTALDIAKALFDYPDVVYAGLVSQFLPIKQDIAVEIAMQLKGYGVSFAKLLDENPYMFTICGFDIPFNTAEQIAYLRGIWNKPELQESRNIAILTSNLTYSDGLDTCFVKKTVLSSPLGVLLSNSDYQKLSSNGSLYAKLVEDNVRCYLSGRMSKYPTQGWIRVNGSYILDMSQHDKQRALESAIKVGILVESEVGNETYIFCEQFLKQELAIIFKCYKLASKPSRYTDIDRIEKLINIFEKYKGFKLEDAQRLGVITTTMNRVSALSGPAGSGKTTTSDCIVFVLEHYNDEDIDSLEPPFEETSDSVGIEFATPTGKAAKRLQEVINRPVSTMHSKFRVGIGSTTLLSNSDEDDSFVEDSANFYVFDEVAMCNLNLLYTVLSRSGNSSIAFLGDICQLPPIGKGLPFRDLLRFIPCTYLKVSKRSLEGSGLTLNSDLINEHSDRSDFKPLVTTNDFKLIECGDDDITNKIYTICGYHLGKVTADKFEQLCGVSPIGSDVLGELKPDDIQVVVPVSTVRYSWGATMLNKRLQVLFNPPDRTKAEFKVCNFQNEKTYRVGDRVIHTDNMYTLQWYSEINNGKEFVKDWGTGLMNGDMGIIVDILKADRKCKFREPNEERPDNYEDSKYKIRKDKSWLGDGRYFVVVQYYDYGRKRNYYVLYQAEINKYEQGRSGLVLAGEDLKSLDLAYALTTHKMQGSQNKLIIYGIGKVARQGFLSRNAVYTGETRAEKGAYMVGNVGSSINSQLNQSRLLASQEGVYTAIGCVYDTV